MDLQQQIEEEAARLNGEVKTDEVKTDEVKTDEVKADEKKVEPAAPQFDILAHYKTTFGIESATKEEAEEQLKTTFTKYNELKDLPDKFTQTQQELETIRRRNEELSSAIDPLKYFANKDGYIREQLLIQHPEYDPNVITKVIGAKLDELSPIEVLVLGRRLKDGDIYKTDTDAIADIEETYSIDLSDEFDNLTPAKQNAIRKEAKTLKSEFSEIKNSVKLPEVVNPETLSAQKSEELRQLQDNLKKGWKPIVESLPTLLDKVQIKNGENTLIEYAIDNNFKADLSKKFNETVEFLAQKGVEVNDEAKAALVAEIKQTYVMNNLGAIMERYAQDKITAMDEATFRELHNSKPANTAEADAAKSRRETSKEKAEDDLVRQMNINH